MKEERGDVDPPRVRFRPDVDLEAFERLPHGEGKQELVRGRLVSEPPPAPLHGRLQVRLAVALDRFVERADLGVVLADAAFLLATTPPTLIAPDLAFVSTPRIPPEPYGRARWPGAPDLAIEIVSPSNRAADLREKVDACLEAGARRVWVVDPAARAVAVHQSGAEPRLVAAGDELDGEDVLPGFRLRLDEFFTL